MVQWRGIRKHEAREVLGDKIIEGNTCKTPTKGCKDRKPFHAVGIINYVPDKMMSKIWINHRNTIIE